MLFARQWTKSEDPDSTCRVPMVTGPCFSTFTFGRTLSGSSKWTVLGGLDSAMHTHFTLSESEEQEDAVLISGASGSTRNATKFTGKKCCEG